MRRPSAINTKVHEDSELFTTTDPSSSQTFLNEPISPSNQNGAMSDTDSVSDSSRLRKKRNTYQKIPDDIRVNLLEAVQKGETLKAAAKRYKINYSSAKSILHTYRKEGRILKKSAQERSIKRKGDASPEHSEEPRPVKQYKKENVQPTSTDDRVSKPVTPLSDKKKPLIQSETNTMNESNVYSKGKSNAGAVKGSKATTARGDDQKSVNKAREQIEQTEMNYTSNPELHKTNKRVDSFQTTTYTGSHLPENDADHHLHTVGDNYNHSTTHGYGADPYGEMMHTVHNRGYPHDDGYHGNGGYFFPHGFGHSSALEDKASKMENGMSFDDFHFGGGFADCPLKSFMDTQNMFREALRKASVFSHGGNMTSGRKDSIDFFKM